MDERRNRFSSIVLLCVLSGVYLFVFSESGLLERINLERKKDILVKGIESMRHEKKRLEETLADYERGLKPESDVINAGFTGRGERVLVLRRSFEGGESLKKSRKDDRPFSMELVHYRVLWIVFSLLIFLFHFSRKNHGEGAVPDA